MLSVNRRLGVLGVHILNITMSPSSLLYVSSTVLAGVRCSDYCRIGNDGGGRSFNLFDFFRFEDTGSSTPVGMTAVRSEFLVVLRLVDGGEND